MHLRRLVQLNALLAHPAITHLPRSSLTLESGVSEWTEVGIDAEAARETLAMGLERHAGGSRDGEEEWGGQMKAHSDGPEVHSSSGSLMTLLASLWTILHYEPPL